MTSSQLRAVFSTKFSPHPSEQQRCTVNAFREALTTASLVSWFPGGSIPDGTFVLVGVMVGWNLYDRELVLALDEAVSDGRVGDDVVAVYAADDLTSREQVDAMFPGLRHAEQSPFLGLWEGRQLRLVDAGSSAKAFLSGRYDLKLA